MTEPNDSAAQEAVQDAGWRDKEMWGGSKAGWNNEGRGAKGDRQPCARVGHRQRQRSEKNFSRSTHISSAAYTWI